MAVDSFFRRPLRTAKGGGTKCTTCEIINECAEGGKCLCPLICVAVDTYELGSCSDPVLINADIRTGAVFYDCALRSFDLSIQCDYDIIDFTMTYEEIYGVQNAVLRSYAMNLEVAVPFTDLINARCPNFDFGVLSTSPYPMVSIGQQMCIDSGPDDCTAGRCLPRDLCMDIYTVEEPDIPLKTSLTWYTSDAVTINSVCCCNANIFPEILVARVVNFSDGCTCIAPQRLASMFFPVEHSGASLNDSGAILHLRHRIASYADDFVSGYPFVEEGSNVWVSEGTLNGDLVQLCPAPLQPVTAETRYIYGRMILWCDAYDGQFKAAFETVDYTSSTANSNTDYTTPYNIYNPFSTVTVMDSVSILACNPFMVRCSGIYEDINCQTLNNVDSYTTGTLEIVVSEFVGWIGNDPITPGGKILLYTERVNAAAAAQTTAADCFPKMHWRTGRDTFKARVDWFNIDGVWPAQVWDGSTWPINEYINGMNVSHARLYARTCVGCPTGSDDPYGPVQTRCCDNKVPRTLYATATNFFDCPCAAGTMVTLTYDAGARAWIGDSVFGAGTDCGCAVRIELSCNGIGGVWEMAVYLNGIFHSSDTPAEGQSFSCDPFLWVTKKTSNNSCCNPAFAASQFYWTITA